MSREKPCFRANAQRIREIYPGKEFLRCHEVAKMLGVCSRTAAKKFGFSRRNTYLSVEDVARIMSAPERIL